MADIRSLCAEMEQTLGALAWRFLDIASKDEAEHDTAQAVADLCSRARAALATPPAVDGPAVPQEGREPAAVVGKVSDEDLYDLAELFNGDPVPAMRRALELWGRPTPAPVEGEVGELLQQLRQASDGASAMGQEMDSWIIARAATLLEQQAAELAVLRAGVQVPVVKRPRGQPGWCDAEGRCWMGDPGGQGFIRSWRFCRPEDAPHMTSSLPHWAILQPPQGGEVQG